MNQFVSIVWRVSQLNQILDCISKDKEKVDWWCSLWQKMEVILHLQRPLFEVKKCLDWRMISGWYFCLTSFSQWVNYGSMKLIDYLKLHPVGLHGISRKCGCSVAMISMINTGKRKPSPSLALKIELATNGDVSRDILLFPEIYSHLENLESQIKPEFCKTLSRRIDNANFDNRRIESHGNTWKSFSYQV